MVRYELAVILKAVSKPQLADTFKRVATAVLGEGAVLRSITNLGERQLPYRMRARSEWHTHGRCGFSTNSASLLNAFRSLA